MPYLIDDPSPFAPLDEWREFLRDMLTIPEQDAKEVRNAVENARETIARIEAREHLGSIVGVEDLWLSPSWEGLAALAAEGVAQGLDDEARRQRQHMPAMFGANPCLPSPHVLKALRAGKKVGSREEGGGR
jgi:hypothetical protein